MTTAVTVCDVWPSSQSSRGNGTLCADVRGSTAPLHGKSPEISFRARIARDCRCGGILLIASCRSSNRRCSAAGSSGDRAQHERRVCAPSLARDRQRSSRPSLLGRTPAQSTFGSLPGTPQTLVPGLLWLYDLAAFENSLLRVFRRLDASVRRNTRGHGCPLIFSAGKCIRFRRNDWAVP